MKIEIEANDLKELVSGAVSLVSPRNFIPELNNIVLCLRDGELRARAQSAGAEHKILKKTKNIEIYDLLEPISVMVEAKRISDAIKGVRGTVEIEVDADYRITIKNGQDILRLKGNDSSLYPAEKLDKDTLVKMSAHLTSSDIKHLTDSRVMLNTEDKFTVNTSGLRLIFTADEIKSVATDGFRIARVKIEKETQAKEEVAFTLAVESVELVRKLVESCDISVVYDRKEVCGVVFSNSTTLLDINVLQTEYIQYERPFGVKHQHAIEVDIVKLSETIKRASQFRDIFDNQVLLNIHDGVLIVRSADLTGQKYSSILTVAADIDCEIPLNQDMLIEMLDLLATYTKGNILIHHADSVLNAKGNPQVQPLKLQPAEQPQGVEVVVLASLMKRSDKPYEPLEDVIANANKAGTVASAPKRRSSTAEATAPQAESVVRRRRRS